MPIGALPIIGAAISGAQSLFQLGEGIRQRRRGRRGLANLERPEYEIPEERLRAATISRAAFADPNTPGQQYATNQAAISAANALAMSSQMGGGLANVAAIQAGRDRATQGIGAQADAFKLQQQANYQSQLQNVAQGRDMEFQINEFAPYAQKYNEYREMIGAGGQNIYDSLGAIGNIGLGLLQSRTQALQNVTNASTTRSITNTLGQYSNQIGQVGSAFIDRMNMAARNM